jgi:hypothetical protein
MFKTLLREKSKRPRKRHLTIQIFVRTINSNVFKYLNKQEVNLNNNFIYFVWLRKHNLERKT